MIQVFNRKNKEYEVENVAGKKYLQWCYDSLIGKKFTEIFIKKKFFSYMYGKYCDTKFSARKVKSFARDFNIDMNESLKDINEFKNFNDFFTRQLKKDARPVSQNAYDLVSPGDGRLTAFTNIDINKVVQIKDFTYSLKELLCNDEVAERYDGGTCLILRLCPLDYHRYHFIDNGICSETHKIKGHYYSVNPIALSNIPKLFCQNKREWSIFKTENFDDVIYVEVGATCVGSIIQTYSPNSPIKKGDEKGYFKFGGSTTILFFKKDTITIDSDILEQSEKGFETHVLCGEKIGSKASSQK